MTLKFYTDSKKRVRPLSSKRRTGSLATGTAHLSVPKNITKHRIEQKQLKFSVNEDLKYWQKRDPNSKIVLMTPDEYLSETPSTYDEKRSAKGQPEEYWNQGSLNYLKTKVDKGEVFETPFLDYSNKFRGWASHEGRHRAFLAKKMGVKKIPVIIITDR